jgi:aminopeptidase N
VADTSVTRTIFDPLTYRKGNATFRQLRAFIGEDAAARVIKRFGDLYAWKNASAADRFAVIQKEVPEKDIDGWIRQWLTSKGISVLTPSISADASGNISDFTITQTHGDNADDILRSHVLNVALYDMSAGRLVRRRSVPVEISGPETSISILKGEKRPDFVFINDDALTYAKVHLDDVSLTTLREHLSAIDNPTARAQVWTALWHMVRDAAMPARQFVDLAITHAVREDEVSVVEKTTARALASIERYADIAARDWLRERLSAAARSRMNDSGLDVSLRLAWLQTYLATALVRDRSPAPNADVEYVRGLLDGDVSLPDLVIHDDVNQRWKLLTALAGAGHATAADIDAEAGRDTSVQGLALALTAKAALPGAADKAWVHRYLTDPQPGDPQMTPQNMRSAIVGFVHAGQDASRAPLAVQFAEAVERMCRDRVEEEATEIVSGLLPDPGPEADSAIADALNAPHLSASVERVLRDAEDDMERIRRGRACDAAAERSTAPV